MKSLLLHAVQVTGMQLLLYLLLPAWTLVRLRWTDAGEYLFASWVAGVSAAALLGQACNGSGIGPAVAVLVWLGGWIIAGLLLRRRLHETAPLSWVSPIFAILLLAWLVRLIHPLQTWALGQSDAYSHLGFLVDVLERGRVNHAVYPPAYAWVLALPAWLLPGPPYWVARFGGAFFGMGMVLGAYALLAQLRGRPAGLAAAALVAGCPAFYLLQKTGVGCFANQLGLLLIPAALWAYAGHRRGWLALVLAGLAVAVPMMLLHVLLLLGLLILLDRDSGRGRFNLLALLAVVFVAVLVMAIQLPLDRGIGVAQMLTGETRIVESAGADWLDVLRVLAGNFFACKRIGYASGALNFLALATSAVFAAALVLGWRRRAAAWRLVGTWGLLASLNVHLGVFQFTNYQREGWSLMLATAALGGLLFGSLWNRWAGAPGRRVLGAGLALAALAGLAVPPGHVFLGGAAESDVVRYLLFLDPQATVLARHMSGFESGQGDVVRTLHPNTISDISELAVRDGPVWFLRDRPMTVTPASRAMQILQPALSAYSAKRLRRGEQYNQKIEAQLAPYPVRVMNISSNLDVWVIRPE